MTALEEAAFRMERVRAIEAAGQKLGLTGVATLRLALALELGDTAWGVVPEGWLTELEDLGRASGTSKTGALRFVLWRALTGLTTPVGDRAVCAVPWQYRMVLEDPAFAAWAVARQRGLTVLPYEAWRHSGG